jgi:signal transduction histidine kinase
MSPLRAGGLNLKTNEGLAQDLSAENLEHRVMVRSALLINNQTRLGVVTITLMLMAMGAMFIPHVGWRHYCYWAVPVLLAFYGRQIWQETLIRRGLSDFGKKLKSILFVSIIAGWMVISSLLIFGSHLPDPEFNFLFIFMTCWVVAAVSILGVLPTAYGIYLAVSGVILLYAFISRGSATQTWLIVPGFVVGIVMVYRMAVGMRGLVDESVRESAKNESMALHLERLNEEQNRSQMAKSRFLAAASHDMKQPVQALGLLVNVLQNTDNPYIRKNVTKEIELATHAVESMITGILDLARIDAGHLEAHQQLVELEPLLTGVMAGYRHRCENKGLSLDVYFKNNLLVYADPMLLQRVLTNLLDNALKYTERGGVTVQVKSEKERVTIKISDTGIGLDPAEMASLQEPFFRGRSAQQMGVHGLGLGLSVIHHMLPLIDADLSFESNSGKGTAAVLSLLPASAATNTERNLRSELPRLTGMTVVVVEDDSIARSAMGLWLQNLGAIPLCVSNLTEAQALVETLAGVDAFIIDFNLGLDQPNGLVVAAQMLEQFPKATFVIVTGELELPYVPPPIKLLRKPVKAETLARLIQANH